MIMSIQGLTSTKDEKSGRLDVHIIGGYCDEKKNSLGTIFTTSGELI